MSKTKILVVDDNAINSMIICKTLEKADYSCQMANNAMEAFGLIASKSFALVLMDIEMPEINGLEATEFIRRLPSDYFRELPIIAITSHRTEDIASKIVEAKMNDVISKPFDTHVFLEKIAKLVSETRPLT